MVSSPVWHRCVLPPYEVGDLTLPVAATVHQCVSAGQKAPEKGEGTTPAIDHRLKPIAGTRVIDEGVWCA